MQPKPKFEREYDIMETNAGLEPATLSEEVIVGNSEVSTIECCKLMRTTLKSVEMVSGGHVSGLCGRVIRVAAD